MKRQGILILGGVLAMALTSAGAVPAQAQNIFNSPTVTQGISSSPTYQSYQNLQQQQQNAQNAARNLGMGYPIRDHLEHIKQEVTVRSTEQTQIRQDLTKTHVDAIYNRVKSRLLAYGASLIF